MANDLTGAFTADLVLSGGTTRDDLQRFPYRPDIVIESLAEYSQLMEEAKWKPFANGSKRANLAPALQVR